MSAGSFVDTSLLIYTDDHRDSKKQQAALRLIEELRANRSGFLSTQVLEEYFVAATRKLGVPADIARAKVELFSELNLLVIELSDIIGAIDLHRLHQISFWDALLIACAHRAGCATILTEDLQPGRRFDGVLIRDPFMA